MQISFFSVLLLFSMNSFAVDRAVSISIPGGILQLTNPTAAAATYDVECYDKSTGTAVITQTNQSLAAKGLATIEAIGNCAGSVEPGKRLAQGPFFCPGSVTYSNRATLCNAANSSPCTIQKLSGLSVTASQFLYGYWLSVDASSTPTWYSTSDGWSKSNAPQDTGDAKKPYAPATTDKSTSSNRCSTGSNGGGYSIQGCGLGNVNSNNSGTLCCPLHNGVASCKVTVKSGHLQSPQFKGGSPF